MESNSVISIVTVIFGAYLLGSISFGILLTRLFIGQDIRTLGSGNTGMTNVLRSAGWVPGVLTGIGDILKGIVAMWVGKLLFAYGDLDTYVGSCLAAVFVLLGHLFPVFFQFKGGKGVATSAGIVLMFDPLLLGCIAVVFIITLIWKRIISLSSLAAVTCLPVFNLILEIIREREALFSTIFTTIFTVLFYITLRDNIKRLKEGTEKKLVVRRTKPTDMQKE